MSFETETVLAHDAPTPQQLRHLTMTGASSAMRRNKLRRLERMKDSYLFIDHLDVPIPSHEVSGTGNARHVVGARLSKLAIDDTIAWGAKYYDTYRVEREPGRWTSQTTLYEFTWQPERTLMAQRTVKVRGEAHAYYPSDQDIDDMIDRFYVHDDEADFWHVQTEFETVTADDCDDFTKMLTDYYARLRQ